jgi:Ala-tRNA(Pro) deacylase
MTEAGEDPLAQLFAGLGIHSQVIEHPPVHTVEEAQPYWRQLEGEHTKNLFLEDNRGGVLHLVTLGAATRIDLKALAGMLGAKKFSFASADTLQEVLRTTPGAVSPLGLVHDKDHRVRFSIERALTQAARLTCHPLRNTATLSLTWAELSAVLRALGVEPLVIDLPPA